MWNNSQRLGSCGAWDFTAIFGTKLISFGNPTEEGLGYSSADLYWINSKDSDTSLSQRSILGQFCRVHCARRGISPPFFGQHPFSLAIQQRRVQAMRARRTVQLCPSTMARRRLKNPSFVDLVGLSCAPRDFSAIFGTIPISLGIRTDEGLRQASTEAYCLML
jgi:hypothetical protein